jgi:hypothetical protein
MVFEIIINSFISVCFTIKHPFLNATPLPENHFLPCK